MGKLKKLWCEANMEKLKTVKMENLKKLWCEVREKVASQGEGCETGQTQKNLLAQLASESS